MQPTLQQNKPLTRGPLRVWFSGSDALTEGTGLCFDRDSIAGAAITVADGFRDKVVAVPDNTNNNSFAGILARSYPAVSGGQWVVVYPPGSVTLIYVTGSVTGAPNNYVTCIAGGTTAGQFHTLPGYMGRGTARLMQTRTGAGLVLAELCDGGVESGLVEIITPLAAGGATQSMVGGLTILAGTVNLNADATSTLADGNFWGQRKGFYCTGDYTTNEYVVTVTSGEQLDGTTDLGAMAFDAADDFSALIWAGHGGGHWQLEHNQGTGLA